MNKNLRPNSINHDLLFKTLLLLVMGFLAVEAIYYIVFLDTWFDEGNFAYKAWMTAEGYAQPFQDFRIKYGPLAFYIQVFLQNFFGPTLIGARILSAIFLTGVATLVYKLGRVLGNRWTGLVALALLVFHPYLVGYYVSVKLYSAAVFFPLLGLWLLTVKRFSPPHKILLASIAITAGMLIRYNMLPVVILFWGFVFWRWRNWKYLGYAVVSSVATFTLSFIPYARLDLEFALIWLLNMFGPFIQLLPFGYGHLLATAGPEKISVLASVIPSEDTLRLVLQAGIKFFHLWIAFGTLILLAILSGWKKSIRFSREHDLLVFLFVATGIMFATHFLVQKTVGGAVAYALYFIPFLILGVTGLLYLLYKKLEARGTWETTKKSFVAFLAATTLFAMPTIAIGDPHIIFFNRFDTTDTDLARVTRGAKFLADHTTKDDLVFTFDSWHHLLLAERFTIPEITSVSLSYYKDAEDKDLLKRYGAYNDEMLLGWVRGKIDVVIFEREFLNDNEFTNAREENIVLFNEILEKQFELAGSIENVYPRKDTRGAGTLEIYRRKNSQ